MAVTISSSYLRNSFQIVAKLSSSAFSEDEAFERAGNIIYEWARQKFSGIFSHMPYYKGSYNDARDGNEIGILYEPDEGSFILRCAHPDIRIPARRWITDTEIKKTENGYVFALRLSVSSLRSCAEKVPFSCPGFVRHIINSIGISDIIPIEDKEHVLSDREDVDAFIKLIESAERKMPVVLVTPCALREDGPYNGYMMSARQMAWDLRGVAHVFEITQPANEYLTETIGRQWSAFNGSVRTYYPGLVFDEINYYSHPLITRQSILRRNAVESDDPELCLHEIEDYVKNYVLSQRINWEGNGIKFYLAAYQDHLLEQRKLNAQTQKEQQDLINSFEMQIKQLEEQRDENAALAESYSGDCEELKAILGQRSQLINNLKVRIANLEYRIEQSGQEQPPVPTDGEYADMEAWVGEYFSDKLVLHPRAIRSLKSAIYEDKELVYKCLVLLATEYYQYQTGYMNYEQFSEACKAVDSSLDERGAITDTAAGMQGDDYFVQYHGKRKKMERHLAKGSSKDRRYCLRIYYFWDDEEQMVVICDMPHHLDTSAT